MVSTFKWLGYLLWGGVDVYCGHRNRTLILSTRWDGSAIVGSRGATGLRMWCLHRAVPLQHRRHPDANRHWDHLLSRWEGMAGHGPIGPSPGVR